MHNQALHTAQTLMESKSKFHNILYECLSVDSLISVHLEHTEGCVRSVAPCKNACSYATLFMTCAI